MMQTLRSKSKYIGAGILALMLVPLLFSTFSDTLGSAPARVAEPGIYAPSPASGKPAPVEPIVYHFDETTQSWVSPGHDPLPLEVASPATLEHAEKPPLGTKLAPGAPAPQQSVQ